jgi:hypothetical protein|eukprot:SAG25_NODE_649_length_6199_cov_2.818361_4_plen_209_part_00
MAGATDTTSYPGNTNCRNTTSFFFTLRAACCRPRRSDEMPTRSETLGSSLATVDDHLLRSGLLVLYDCEAVVERTIPADEEDEEDGLRRRFFAFFFSRFFSLRFFSLRFFVFLLSLRGFPDDMCCVVAASGTSEHRGGSIWDIRAALLLPSAAGITGVGLHTWHSCHRCCQSGRALASAGASLWHMCTYNVRMSMSPPTPQENEPGNL